MPEARVLQFFKREICFKAKTRKTKVREPDWDTKCTGRLVTHIPCLSRKDGNKQTITFHEAPLDDSLFLPIAIPAGQKKKGTSRACSRCQKSGAKAACRSDDFNAEPGVEAVPPFDKQQKMYSGELLNALNISGQLSVEVRGKELVLLIGGSYAIRVNFCMEGHCFWMPTKMYEAIVDGGVHSRGEKSKSFHVPHHLTEAPPIVDVDGDDSESEDDNQSTTEDDSDEESETNSTLPTLTEPKPKKYKGITLSIQLAFVCPEWTLIFTDHNTCFNVHVMPLRYYFQPEDISFGGQ